MIPVMPPKVNVDKNPSTKYTGVVSRMLPPHNVATQLNILTPVGMPTSIVMIMNGSCTHGARPLVNMWCAQTANETSPIATDEYAIALYPKMGRRQKVGKISETMPNAGKI